MVVGPNLAQTSVAFAPVVSLGIERSSNIEQSLFMRIFHSNFDSYTTRTNYPYRLRLYRTYVPSNDWGDMLYT